MEQKRLEDRSPRTNQDGLIISYLGRIAPGGWLNAAPEVVPPATCNICRPLLKKDGVVFLIHFTDWEFPKRGWHSPYIRILQNSS